MRAYTKFDLDWKRQCYVEHYQVRLTVNWNYIQYIYFHCLEEEEESSSSDEEADQSGIASSSNIEGNNQKESSSHDQEGCVYIPVAYH